MLKKHCFWPIFPIFWAKKIFIENPALSYTSSYGFLASCQNLEKTNDTISRKRPDRRKDGQTLFHRTLLANVKYESNGDKNRNLSLDEYLNNVET